jgi:hypothetical protein
MKEELELSERAVTGGVRATVEDTKTDLRRDVARAGLGQRLAKSWRHKVYPKTGSSLAASGIVYTKAEKLIRVYDRGAVIRSSEGFWLAIPTEHAPKYGQGRKRINPSNFPEWKLGKLRFVYRKSGVSLLVVDNQRQKKGGGYAPSRSKRALKSGHGLSTVIMFFLVPQVRLRKRLNVDRVIAGNAGNLARNIDSEFRRLQRKG